MEEVLMEPSATNPSNPVNPDLSFVFDEMVFSETTESNFEMNSEAFREEEQGSSVGETNTGIQETEISEEEVR